MIYLTAEDVIAFNAIITGPGGLRDPGAVESACGRPQATVFGADAYPDAWQKAAALMQSITCNHAFTDGNKRTAWISVATFLDINGHPMLLPLDEDSAETLVLAVATGAMRDVSEIAEALRQFFS